jgi:replicative DNA helicase
MAETTSALLSPRVPAGGGDPAASAFTGRTPPHSAEAEEYLLSCCLLDGGDTIARCLEAKLAPQAFYLPANRVIFEKLCELYQRSPPVAIEMLIEELRTTKQLEAVGGVPYLMQVSSRIPTTAQAVYFIEKVRELYLLRELIKVTTSTVEQCFSYQGGLEEFID